MNALPTKRELGDALECGAGFVADLSTSWRATTDEQPSALDRLLFADVRTKDSRIVSGKPPSNVAQFLDLDNDAGHLPSGGNGLRSRARTTSTGFDLVGLPPLRRTVGVSGRAPYTRQRPRRLSDDERFAIRSLACRQSLRSLAANYGVSHETLRTIVQGRHSAIPAHRENAEDAPPADRSARPS